MTDTEGVIDYHTLAASVTQHSRAGQELSFYAMSPDPSTAWATAMRLREAMLDHVRSHHPDWWPYERFDGPHIEPQLTAVRPHLDTKSDD